MMDFMLGWLIGKSVADNQTEQKIINYEPSYTLPKRKEITVYEYWPAFDNDIPSLETAYKLYEENHTCHVIQDGVCKCYFEFDGDDGYIETEPDKFFERI